jgi:hypothetical protein
MDRDLRQGSDGAESRAQMAGSGAAPAIGPRQGKMRAGGDFRRRGAARIGEVLYPAERTGPIAIGGQVDDPAGDRVIGADASGLKWAGHGRFLWLVLTMKVGQFTKRSPDGR